MLIRARCLPRVGNKWHQDVVGNSSVRLMKRAVGIRISPDTKPDEQNNFDA